MSIHVFWRGIVHILLYWEFLTDTRWFVCAIKILQSNNLKILIQTNDNASRIAKITFIVSTGCVRDSSGKCHEVVRLKMRKYFCLV